MTRMSHRYWPDHPETPECAELDCQPLDERDEWDRWNTVRDACALAGPQALEDFEHIRADVVRDRTALTWLRGNG